MPSIFGNEVDQAVSEEGSKDGVEAVNHGRVHGKTKQEIEDNLKKVVEMVQEAGWNINWGMTVKEASKALFHQGFITCTDPLMYLLPDFNVNYLLEIIEDFLEKKERKAMIMGELWAPWHRLQ